MPGDELAAKSPGMFQDGSSLESKGNALSPACAQLFRGCDRPGSTQWTCPRRTAPGEVSGFETDQIEFRNSDFGFSEPRSSGGSRNPKSEIRNRKDLMPDERTEK